MKVTLLTSLIILLFSQTHAQKLSNSEKKIWKAELKVMEEADQLYRKLMVDFPEMDNDSIWELQTKNDSINKAKFIELTKLYGYPSYKNIGYEASIALILHFTLENDFHDLKDLFKTELEKGNMLPSYYAWWYDRCQRNMGNPIFYGQYTNQKEFCGEDWKKYNERRKEIGLDALTGKAICDSFDLE